MDVNIQSGVETPRHKDSPTRSKIVGRTCSTCKHWARLGEWWGRCNNDYRTAIETEDPGAGPEMTRKTFACSEWSPLNDDGGAKQ